MSDFEHICCHIVYGTTLSHAYWATLRAYILCQKWPATHKCYWAFDTHYCQTHWVITHSTHIRSSDFEAGACNLSPHIVPCIYNTTYNRPCTLHLTHWASHRAYILPHWPNTTLSHAIWVTLWVYTLCHTLQALRIVTCILSHTMSHIRVESALTTHTCRTLDLRGFVLSLYITQLSQ